MRHIHLILALCYPPAVHFSLVSAHADWALWMLLAVSLSQLLLTARQLAQQKLLLLVPVTVVLLCLYGLREGKLLALYLPPFAIQLGLLWLFGSSLGSGREPVITRIARTVFREEDPAIIRYTRGVTWVWTLFFAALFTETLLLTLFAPVELWSLFANLLNYLMIALLFLSEYAYRRIRFPRQRSVGQLIELLATTDWPALLRGGNR